MTTAPKNGLAKIDLSKQAGADDLAALRFLNYYLLTTSERKHNASAK